MNLNTTGANDTAVGSGALQSNTTGNRNVAMGVDALNANSDGSQNIALGVEALVLNTGGGDNVAVGNAALFSNTTGFRNIGIGNINGARNVALGNGALGNNSSGTDNLALGNSAGTGVTTGISNVHIANTGAAGDTKTIRIGRQGTHTRTFIAGIRGVTVSSGAAVVVNSAGQLGVQSSSRRFKTDIAPMGEASSALLALEPVTFRYEEADDHGLHPLQYGLVAEDVAKVFPDLVLNDQDGRAETVAYQTLSSVLLNEFQKEHARREAEATRLRAALDEERRQRLAAEQRLEATLAALGRQQAARDNELQAMRATVVELIQQRDLAHPTQASVAVDGS